MQKPIEIIDNENVDFFVKFVLFLYKAKSFDSSFAGGKEDRVLCYSKITSPPSHGFGGQAGERPDLIVADFS